MGQTINITIDDAAYSGAKYGGSASSWENGYYEIYAAREGEKSGSTYFTSRLKFTAPAAEADVTGNLCLQLKVSRNLGSNGVGAILATQSLTGKEIYDKDTIELIEDLEGFIGVVSGERVTLNNEAYMQWNFYDITLIPNTVYYIYLRRYYTDKSFVNVQAPFPTGDFMAVRNPVYSDKQRTYSYLTLASAEEAYPTDTEVVMDPATVEITQGIETAQTFRLHYTDGTEYSSSTLKWTYVAFEGNDIVNTPAWLTTDGKSTFTFSAEAPYGARIEVTATWGKDTIYSLIGTMSIPLRKWSGLRDWIRGYAISMATMPYAAFVGLPTRFNYHSHELPWNNNYNQDEFSYACIDKDPLMHSTYITYISDKPFVVNEHNEVQFNPDGAKVKMSTITMEQFQEWTEFIDIIDTSISFTPLWTNKDITNTQGMVVFETYSPIPIYYTKEVTQ